MSFRGYYVFGSNAAAAASAAILTESFEIGLADELLTVQKILTEM